MFTLPPPPRRKGKPVCPNFCGQFQKGCFFMPGCAAAIMDLSAAIHPLQKWGVLCHHIRITGVIQWGKWGKCSLISQFIYEYHTTQYVLPYLVVCFTILFGMLSLCYQLFVINKHIQWSSSNKYDSEVIWWIRVICIDGSIMLSRKV